MTNLIYEPKGKAREYAALACNLYRGCGHKCSYCLSGDTLILASDMLAIPLREIQVGDELLGTAVLGRGLANNTKFVPSRVEAVWTTRKRVFEIELENGMTARCSGDHRWLTNRGWKFTTGRMCGKGQRPYLTTNNYIRVVTSPIQTPVDTDDYKKGYLSGIIRGDGHIGVHGPYRRECIRKDRPNNPYIRIETAHAFSLRLVDREPLDRATAYLADFGIAVSRFQFMDNMQGIRTRSRDKIDRIKNLISWRSTTEYLRGFIAGIYDAEGSFLNVVRFSNSDPEILAFCEKSLIAGGLPFIYDVPHQGVNTIVHSIRLRGGRETKIKFWQWSNPAIERKRTIMGYSLKERSRVTRITDLGHEETLYDIQTSSGNFVANGMISHNCYAPSATRRSRSDFSQATTRPNFLPKLRKEAAKRQRARLGGQVLLCFTCDPYQPLDVEEQVTRQAINILHQTGHTVCVLTKGGTRALRDLDLFGPGDAFATTLTWLDNKRSREWEPDAALPYDRIATLIDYHDAGITTWVSLEPVLDPAVALSAIRQTRKFVDLYKVSKVNYHPLAQTIDWRKFGMDAIDLLRQLGKPYYIKKDLAQFLPANYFKLTGHNPVAPLVSRYQKMAGQMSMF